MLNRFGTTSDMVIQTVEENGRTLHLAIDESGLYLTTKDRLDSQFADKNRQPAAREGIAERLKALGLNPEELAAANQHLIKKATAEPAKKVNPLKASKRGAKSK